MIIGIGTDIISISRIRSIWDRFGDKFLNRVFNPQEIKDSFNHNNNEIKARFFAKRFAAKEAFVKALGTGFGYNGLNMSDIIIQNNELGKPTIIINENKLQSFFNKDYITHLSLSDDQDFALAFVVLSHKTL